VLHGQPRARRGQTRGKVLLPYPRVNDSMPNGPRARCLQNRGRSPLARIRSPRPLIAAVRGTSGWVWTDRRPGRAWRWF